MEPSDPQKNWNHPKPETLATPTWYPAALAFGATLFTWGLVSSLIISGIGIVVSVFSIAGWIGEIRHEHKSD
jgi:hypothetical protein